MRPEPIAIAFANTRSSPRRDRIETLTLWRAWIDAWPSLGTAGRAVDVDGLAALRRDRDDVQLLLHSIAGGQQPRPEPTERLLDAARSTRTLELRWPGGHPVLAVPDDVTAATVIAQHLIHAALDLVLTGPPLAACQGRNCRKLFVATRPDRRWCDSAICGNRARVRAHDRRTAHAADSTGAAGPAQRGGGPTPSVDPAGDEAPPQARPAGGGNRRDPGRHTG
ncbi:CGNR zinc finger domain-containing protein [Plantactinospora sp. WMMB782]|uniref:CGNR zinc finger domain-containing protein n=1 Tax=Plantactinospora sp. WMMB782 TaxID=3404121 RepID=UPI003B962C65